MAKANARRRYSGPPLERGGTSIAGNPCPEIVRLVESGAFGTATRLLDFGAGRYGRNASWLRRQGFEVYAYDPYNGAPSVNGWKATSNKLPRAKFDVGFTSFVLNVVPEYSERAVIRAVSRLSRERYHVTRNKDIFSMAKRALAEKDQVVGGFFINEFARPGEAARFRAGMLTDRMVLDFCLFGFRTARGFQRIPTSEESGLEPVVERHTRKVYRG